jgi:hypothetical protein
MRLTQKQFERFRPMNNWVLIKPNRGTDEVYLNRGTDEEMKFYIDFKFDPAKHAPVVGTAVKVPENLFYSETSSNSIPWKTEMELREGDEVFYNYLSASVALGLEENKYGKTYEDTRIITVEGDDNIYILVKYDKVYVAKRGENKDVVPINGYILVEPLEKKYVKTFLELPEMVKTVNKNSTTYGIVRHKGTRLECYQQRPMYNDPSERSLKVGDIVAMENVSDIPLEYDMHAEFDKKTTFYRIQGRQVLAIMRDYENVQEEYIPLVNPEQIKG